MDRNIDNIDATRLNELFNRPARPSVGVDVEKYKALLDDPALSEAEKENFLQALWSVVVTFVDLGFGVHPLQLVREPEDEPFPEALKEAFDSAEQPESNKKSKRDGGPAGSLEME